MRKLAFLVLPVLLLAGCVAYWNPEHVVVGTILDEDGNPVAGVTILASTGATATTDADGRYTITLRDRVVTLTPEAAGWAFAPPSVEIAAVTGTRTVDFTALARPIITGSVKKADGTPVPGISLRASDGTTAVTDASGNFSMSLSTKPATIYPVGEDADSWLFEPLAATINGSATVNFVVRDLPDDLIGYWSFNNTMGTASLTQGSPTFVDGAAGPALRLSSNEDGALGTGLHPPSITVAFWMQRTQSMASNNEWVAFWAKPLQSWDANGWFITFDGRNSAVDAVRFMGNGTNAFETDVGNFNSTFPQNEWVHVAFTYDAETGDRAIYINGVPQPVTGNISGISPVNDPVLLGINGYGGARFGANMDDLRIYSRALSAAEIADLADLSKYAPTL